MHVSHARAGLTFLSIAGTKPSSGAIFCPLLFHFAQLRHLDLSNCSAFSAASAPALTQVRSQLPTTVPMR